MENKLTPAQKLIANDMLDSWGEWLSIAWERKKDKIILYPCPKNLKCDGKKYIIVGNQLIYTCENEFPLARNVPASTWIGLNKFDAGLVQFLYGRQFVQLPQKMREGGKRAQLYLLPENTLWPLSRGDYDFYVDGFSYNNWASR